MTASRCRKPVESESPGRCRRARRQYRADFDSLFFMDNETMITIDHKNRLYVIPCGGGYSCLGFDYAERKRRAILEWRGMVPEPVVVGTEEAYREYLKAIDLASNHFDSTGQRCPVELTPALIGLEGRRVEVTEPSGEKRRFKVGKSAGFIPCHTELANRRSCGGPAAYVPEGSIVRVVR